LPDDLVTIEIYRNHPHQHFSPNQKHISVQIIRIGVSAPQGL
jgi:hypothetical protein